MKKQLYMLLCASLISMNSLRADTNDQPATDPKEDLETWCQDAVTTMNDEQKRVFRALLLATENRIKAEHDAALTPGAYEKFLKLKDIKTRGEKLAKKQTGFDWQAECQACARRLETARIRKSSGR